jgi:IS30 family transposase
VKRNTVENELYSAVTAQACAVSRSNVQRNTAPLKNTETWMYVREKLRIGWSPQIIAGRLSIDYPHLSISHETIYQYIYGRGKKFHLEEYLVRSHKKRRIKTGRNMYRSKSRIPNAVMIDSRSTKANNRTQIGHFETDLMEGRRTTSTVLCVALERKSRYTLLMKAPNKQSDTIQNILQNSLQTLQSLQKSNKPIVQSITSDNGRENTHHIQTSNTLNTKWYFTHPYHSWEKGSVENRIGVIRRYIPKGSTIHNYPSDAIQYIQNILNTRPMKVLNYQTPEEVFTKEVNTYKFNRYKLLQCCV